MSVKLVVLYPPPIDEEEFERRYVGEHLPLMRTLLGPDVPLPTYRILSPAGGAGPYYRVAEIHFRDAGELQRFARSEGAERGRASSVAVSTGGPPLLLVCEQQPDVPAASPPRA